VQETTLLAAARVFAAAITLAAFWLYNKQDGKISAGTWWILATGDSLDFASYWGMTENWWKIAVPAAFAVASIITFLYALAKKRFSWPDRTDLLIIGLDGVITLGWWQQFATATTANLLYQATAVMAFVPMYRGLYRNREKEVYAPWMLWSLAHFIFFITAAMEHESYAELAYPLVGLLTHLAVIAFETKRRARYLV